MDHGTFQILTLIRKYSVHVIETFVQVDFGI